MEWSLPSRSMFLKAKFTPYEICSNGWKTGSNSSSRSWGFGRLYWKTHTGTTLKFVHREPGSKHPQARAGLSPSKGNVAWAITNSCPGNGTVMHRGLGEGNILSFRLDQGTRFTVLRRPSTAVEAGRSKAKKGQPSGGRIERRPPSSRRPQPSKQGESLDRTAEGRTDGSIDKGGQQQVRDVGLTDEEELNLTWQDAGLGDRRSRGKFQPARGGRPPREAQRVGGWGRDKSMQRVISPEQQREAASRERERQKSQTSEPPAIKKKKTKLYEDFDDDPSVIHPPEYYKDGPFGPFASKGIVVGELVRGTFATNQVVFFSNVENEAESEDRRKANVAVSYTEMVAKFDVSIGIKYFYAFARRRYGPRPDPWKDWTLVAQIAVELRDEVGEQGDLFRKMGSRTQDCTAQCVAWARPDLVYVRKPRFQLRLEPQENFLKELFDLLHPTTGEGRDSDSYYATLCRLVNVDLEASPGSVTYGYEALDEEGKLECLKHLFTRHPVKILSSARYDRQVREQQGEQEGEDGLGYEPFDEEFYDKANESLISKEDNSDCAVEVLEPSRNSEGSKEIRSLGESGEGSRGQSQPDDGASPTKPFSPRGGRGLRGKKRVYNKPFFRSAVRPFSYSNLIEEIAQIRMYLSQKQSRVSGS